MHACMRVIIYTYSHTHACTNSRARYGGSEGAKPWMKTGLHVTCEEFKCEPSSCAVPSYPPLWVPALCDQKMINSGRQTSAPIRVQHFSSTLQDAILIGQTDANDS